MSFAKFHLVELIVQQYNDVPQGYKVEIKFWGADHSPNQRPLPPTRWQTSIHIDISHSEQLVLPPVEKIIIHPYSDKNVIFNTAVCYDFKELFSEKIRALKQRNRPRDVYDVWFLSKAISTDSYDELKMLLYKKLAIKNLIIDGASDFVNEDKRMKNKRAWNQSLSHQLNMSGLPEFDVIYNELENFINKLLF